MGVQVSMNEFDDIIQRVNSLWDENVSNSDQYTRPWLDITEEKLEKIKQGIVCGYHDPVVELPFDHKIAKINRKLYGDLKGKKLLCLASGGGQQSVIYSLLGADVTVFDLNEKQLKNDRLAADYYGYSVKTVQGDMRDLSFFDEQSFDLVYQPISACFIPELKPLYSEVYRVLKTKGLYMVEHMNPATYPITFFNNNDGWDNIGYRIATPYICGPIRKDDYGNENMLTGTITGEFRHSFADIFGDLAEAGFIIDNIWEDTRHLISTKNLEGGSYEHFCGTIQLFINTLSHK